MNLTLWELWLHGTRLWVQPFSFFGTILALSVFIFAWHIIVTIKEVIENGKQHLLW